MPPFHMLLAVLVAVFWGGNFVSVKYGMQQFPPFYITFLRFVLVALLMLPLVKRPPRGQMRPLLLLALLSTFHFTLGLMGLWMGLDIATAIIVAQLSVPISCLFGALFLKDHLGMWRSSGILVAFGGVVVIAGNADVTAHWLGFLLAILGATVWALSNIVIKRIEGMGAFSMLGWTAIFSSPMLLALSWLIEGNQSVHLLEMKWETGLSIFYTAVFSTVASHGAWYYLLRRYPMSYVTPFSLLVPFFGISLGQVFFAAPLTWRVALGGFLTILGVAIIVIRRPKLAARTEF